MASSALACALLAPTLVGCASAPAARTTSAHGFVEAPSAESARFTSELVDVLVPRLAALDVGLVPRRVDVQLIEPWDSDADIYGGYDASRQRIVLAVGHGDRDATLAHELVHAMEPADWAPLPAVVREGLADHLAARVIPRVEHAMRASRALALAGYCGLGLPVEMRLNPDDRHLDIQCVQVRMAPLPPPLTALAVHNGDVRDLGNGQELGALYALGLLIVERAGIARLEDLAQEARDEGLALVPAARVLAAADLSPDAGEWLAALTTWVAGPDDQRAMRARVRQLALRTDPDAPPTGVRD